MYFKGEFFFLFSTTVSFSPSELKEAQRKKRQMKERFKQEEIIANAMVIWNTEVLPNWESM